MEFKDLCRERIRGDRFYETSKPSFNLCADVFEAIIGGLYYYLYYYLEYDDTLEILYNWFLSTWPINDIFDTIIRTGNFICPIPSQKGAGSTISPRSRISRSLQQSQMLSRRMTRSVPNDPIVISDEEDLLQTPFRRLVRSNEPIIINNEDEELPTMRSPTRQSIRSNQPILIIDEDEQLPTMQSQIPIRPLLRSNESIVISDDEELPTMRSPIRPLLRSNGSIVISDDEEPDIQPISSLNRSEPINRNIGQSRQTQRSSNRLSRSTGNERISSN